MAAWIALTGGIGSGKSQAARCFRQLGVPVIDADEINRRLISVPDTPALAQIAAAFGAEMLDAAGCLNRAAMRRLIFADAAAKQRLERILHPLIIRDIRAGQAQYAAEPYGLVELPTLAEHPHFRVLVQRVLLIVSDKRTRITRVMARNGLSEKEVCAIIAAQSDDAQRLTLTDDVIDNSGSLQDLADRVREQHMIYQRTYAVF